MIKNLKPVVSMILNSFQDSHARVRWAAINAIGQLSTDLGPDLQQDYHQQVLPALINAMDDFQSPRVQVGHQLLDGWYSTSSLIPVAFLDLLLLAALTHEIHICHLAGPCV